MAHIRHLAQLAYGLYCVGWLIWRWYRFMQEHHTPKAEVITLFSGEK